MKERIVVVFIAIAIGLVATTLVFFLYQQTKTLPKNVTSTQSAKPTPTPDKTSLLVIDSPVNESLSNKRSIVVKGKTDPTATVVVSTNQADDVVKPTADGKFSVTIAIDAGANKIVTRAIMPDGVEESETRIVTYSTDEF